MNSRRPTPKAGIAARLGGWSTEHRRKAIFGWIGLLLVSIVIGSVGAKKLTTASSANGDSAKAERLLDRGGFKQPAAEEVLIQSGGRISTQQGARAAAAVIEAVRGTGRVQNVRSPFASGNGGQISKDGRSALVLFSMKGKAETANKRVQPVVDAVARVAASQPNLRIEQFGQASATKALDKTIGNDFKKAERSSIPITFLILWLAFAAFVAALLPVVLALTAIVAATGIVALTSHVLPIDGSASSMILLIGLAVGVDYSLFYVKRTREERVGGASTRGAVKAAAATSGKAVLISGLTVVAAMAAMFATGQGTFMGMAEATAIVVVVAMIGSLTVVPALLATLGDRVDRGRIPFLGRKLRRDAPGASRFWAWVVRPALEHPLKTAIAAVAILAALALPAARLQTAVPGATDLPPKLAIMQTFERIQHAFPGGPQPAQVVVAAPNVDAPAV